MRSANRFFYIMLLSFLASSCQKELYFDDIDLTATPALFSLGGDPGSCTGVILAGNYQSSIETSAANTIMLDVNVTVPGTYNISTDTINGISFSTSGTFVTPGAQQLLLAVTGTPLEEGSFDFIVDAGSSTCTFTVLFDVAPAPVFSCIIDNIPYSFYNNSSANVNNGNGAWLYLNGYSTAVGSLGNFFRFQVYITRNPAAGITVGSYDILGYPDYTVSIDFTSDNLDGSGITVWNTSSSITSSNPFFTIDVTSIGSLGGRAAGTFSGTLTNTAQGSTAVREITSGVFDLRVQ